MAVRTSQQIKEAAQTIDTSLDQGRIGQPGNIDENKLVTISGEEKTEPTIEAPEKFIPTSAPVQQVEEIVETYNPYNQETAQPKEVVPVETTAAQASTVANVSIPSATNETTVNQGSQESLQTPNAPELSQEAAQVEQDINNNELQDNEFINASNPFQAFSAMGRTFSAQDIADQEVAERVEAVKKNQPGQQQKSEATPNIKEENLVSANEKIQSNRANQQAGGKAWKSRRPVPVLDRLFQFGKREKRKKDLAHAVNRRSDDGTAFYMKLVSNRKLYMDEVGIGIRYLEDIIMDPESNFINKVCAYLQVDPSTVQTLEQVVDLVNTSTIPVACFKSPNLTLGSANTRTLRIVNGDGVSLHPTQAKMYNADFDGDEMTVSLDPRASKMYPNAMQRLINEKGQSVIDVDWWPMLLIKTRDQRRTAFGALKNELVKYGKRNGKGMNELVNIALDMSEAYNSGKHEAAETLMVDLIRKAYSVSNQSPRMTSRILTDLYNVMRDIQGLYLAKANGGFTEYVDVDNPRDSFDEAYSQFAEYLDGYVDKMAAGVIPLNMQEIKAVLNSYIGEVGGKNIVFRDNGSLSRLYRFDDKVTFGTDYGREQAIYQTMEYILSKKISEQANAANAQSYAASYLRSYIIGKVGFPDTVDANGRLRYPNFREWARNFINEYQQRSVLINLADDMWNTDFSYAGKSNNRSHQVRELETFTRKTIVENGEEIVYDVDCSAKEFAMAVEIVYKDYSLEKLLSFGLNEFANKPEGHEWSINKDQLGGLSISMMYKDRSIHWFTRNNRLPQLKRNVQKKDKNGKTVSVREKVKFNELMISSDQFDAEAFVYALADMKSTTFSSYNTLMYGDKPGKQSVMKNALQSIKALNDYLGDLVGRADISLDLIKAKVEHPNIEFCQYQTKLLASMGPDLFEYFGIDNFETFISSKWGRYILNATTVEQLGGIRFAMVAEYRLSRLRNAEKNAESLSQSTGVLPSTVMKAVNDIDYENGALMSSSDVWYALITDSQNGSPVYKALISNPNETISSALGKNAKLNYDKYEETKAMLSKYDSALDLLLDPTVSKTVKDEVLSDLTRTATKNMYVSSYDVAYKLEQNPDPIFTQQEPGQESVMTVAEASINAYRGFKKYPFSDYFTKEEVEFLNEHKEEFTTFINEVAKNPALSYQMDDNVFCDMLTAVLDKSYEQGGKTKNNPLTQAFSSSLFNLLHGGVDSDVYRGDDRALGFISADKLSSRNFVDLIMNPNGVAVYDSDGNILQIPEVESVRLAKYFVNSFCKSTCLPIKKNIEGDVYYCRTETIQESLLCFNDMYNAPDYNKQYAMSYARNVLLDHPTFCAACSLITATKNRSSRTLRNEYKRNRETLSFFVCAMANEQKKGIAVNVGAAMNEYLGISKASIKAALLTNPNISDEQKSFALEDGCMFTVDEYVENLYGILEEAFSRYIDELGSYVDGKTDYDLAALKRAGSKVTMDFESCAAFFDVRQEVTGSRIASSIGIEGSETFRFAAPAFLLNAQDKYTGLDTLSNEDLEYLISQNAETNMGPLSSIDIDELSVNEAKNLVIKVPEGFVIKDKTLNDEAIQMQTLGTFLVVKRDDGSENFNMKERKYGCNDMDSATKWDHRADGRFTVNNAELRQELKSLCDGTEEGIFKARLHVAKILLKANHSMGYRDMSLANYMNLAELIVQPTADNTDVYIRSIEMILEKIKNSIAPYMIDELTLPELRAYANRVFEEYVPTDSKKNILKEAHNLKYMEAPTNSTALRHVSSSWSRNYETIETLRKNYRGYSNAHQPSKRELTNARSQLMKREKNQGPIPLISEALGQDMFVVNDSTDPSTMASTVSFGPRTVQVLAKRGNKEIITESFREAYVRGNTIVVTGNCLDLIPERFIRDLVPCPGLEGIAWMIPMFDLRQNGSEAFAPTPRPAFWIGDPNKDVVSVEDSVNEFSLGDSAAIVSQALVDRINVRYTGTESMSVEAMFPNVAKAFTGKTIRYSLLSEVEVQDLIVDKTRSCTIDYGVTESSPNFARIKNRVDKLIEEFAANGINAKGFADEARAGGIVGWACATIKDVDSNGVPVTNVVIAPIIPFQQHIASTRTYTAPRKYKVRSVDFSQSRSNSLIDVQWEYCGDVTDTWMKVHEGAGAANKMVASLAEIMEERKLKNGVPIDMMYALETTKSRRGGTNRRIKSMESLIRMMRLEGYNFADAPTSFPDSDPKDENSIKNRVRLGKVTLDEWIQILSDENFRFDTDPELNSFIKLEAQKFIQWGQSPTDFLISHYYSDVDGAFRPTCVKWEYAFQLQSTYTYQDMLLRFFNRMKPESCPPGLDADYNGEHWRVNKDGDSMFDFGCLQMQVPRSYKGKTYYTWENVIVSETFVGNEFSGFRATNKNSAHDYMDALYAGALSGKMPADENIRAMLRWALLDKFDERSLNGHVEFLMGKPMNESSEDDNKN